MEEQQVVDQLVIIAQGESIEVVRSPKEMWRGFVFRGRSYHPIVPVFWNGDHRFLRTTDGTIIGVDYILHDYVMIDADRLAAIRKVSHYEVARADPGFIEFRIYFGADRHFDPSGDWDIAVVEGQGLFWCEESDTYAFVFTTAWIKDDDLRQLQSRFPEEEVQLL